MWETCLESVHGLQFEGPGTVGRPWLSLRLLLPFPFPRECVLCFRSARWWLPCPRLAHSPSSPSALAFAGQALPPTPLPHAQCCFLPSSRPPITPQAATSLHACPFICWPLFSLALPLWNFGDSTFLFVALGCDLLLWGSYSHL